MLGYSGATIEVRGHSVLKIGGPIDVRKQAELCRMFGTETAPIIYWIGADSYCMEKLQSLKSRDYATLYQELKIILSKYVWNRREQNYNYYWRDYVKQWMIKNVLEFSADLIFTLYPPTTDDPCLIHGDSTLANLMQRDEQYILIDPVPSRRHVPSFREVDLGCMLQSAAGWENLLEPEEWDLGDFEELSGVILACETDSTRQRAYFWASYKCHRILFHAQRKNISDWSGKWAERFLAKALKL